LSKVNPAQRRLAEHLVPGERRPDLIVRFGYAVIACPANLPTRVKP
jgi:hypothetical protein